MQMTASMFLCGSCIAVGAIAACGSVGSQAAPDGAAPTMDAAMLRSCAPPALITAVESTDPGYGNSCVHGVWTLEAFNGTTTPVAVGQPNNTTDVAPTAITAGSNPLDKTSTFAVHVSGSGQENTPSASAFVQLTASLNTLSPTDVGVVDASQFTGIQFFAMLSTGSTGARLTVGDLFTDPAGGLCNPQATTNNTGCFDNPGAQLTMTAGKWMLFQVPFASLSQLGFGFPSPVGDRFPKQAITHIKWDIGVPKTGLTEPWDLWVDDLGFY